MGEIKSTLELAMERTKKFSISEKEREEMKRKEVFQKAASLFHRYRDGLLSLHEIQKQVDKMEKATATAVKELLLSQWIDALSLDDDYEKIFKGVELFEQRNIAETRQEFCSLLSRYQSKREKIKEKAKLQLIEGLRKDGISGSAVEPNLERNELWEKENEELSHSFKTALEQIKAQLKVHK